MYNIDKLKHINSNNFLLIAGPCVVESKEIVEEIAEKVVSLSDKYSIPLIFKASYRKANRSRLDSFTGIGDKEGLNIIAAVGEKYNIPVITDIHNPEEAAMAADYVDILQIPAFLCRQTDILRAAAQTGKWINIKKGQFLSGDSMSHAVDKVRQSGNNHILLTDRGNMFGYGDLIVDFRNIPTMQKFGVPVIMDITHSLQQPNQMSGVTGGMPEMIATIGKAAIAVGADGIFLETHPEPAKALSDGANMLKLDNLDMLLSTLVTIRKAVQSTINSH